MRVDYNVLKWYDSLAEQEYRKPYAFSNIPTLPIEMNQVPPFQLIRARTGASIIRFDLVEFKTGTATDVLTQMGECGLQVLQPDGKAYDIIYYPSTVRLDIAEFDRGGYYAVMGDGVNTWYSDVFTMTPYLGDHIKLIWCHHRDFEFTGGHIQYTTSGYGNGYKNYLWIDTYIVKPKYEYEREVKTRDGIEFPLRWIRKKVYRFEYIGPESIIDALSVVEGHDVKMVIDQNGQTFEIIEFEMSDPEWFAQGNQAPVTITLVTEKVVIPIYANVAISSTCEVAAGTCIAPTGSYQVVRSHILQGGPEWVGGYYYNADGAQVYMDADNDDYVTAGPDGARRVYKFNAPNDYTVQDLSGFYTKIYYENTDEYWYDRGEGLHVRQSKITGYTPLTDPYTFYGQTGNDEALYELWIEDEGGGQTFVQRTDNDELNLGVEIDAVYPSSIVLKTVTVKCGVIMEHRFAIPAEYTVFTGADDDSAIILSDDDAGTIYLGSDDIDSVPTIT